MGDPSPSSRAAACRGGFKTRPYAASPESIIPCGAMAAVHANPTDCGLWIPGSARRARGPEMTQPVDGFNPITFLDPPLYCAAAMLIGDASPRAYFFLASSTQLAKACSLTTRTAIGMKAWSLPQSSEHCP